MHTALAGEALYSEAPPLSPQRSVMLVIYFIHGPDRLLARQAALDIANDVDPDGHNTSWLDGRETSLAKVSAPSAAVSFFGTPRVVVVSDFLPRSNRDADSDAEGSEGASPAVAGLRDSARFRSRLQLFDSFGTRPTGSSRRPEIERDSYQGDLRCPSAGKRRFVGLDSGLCCKGGKQDLTTFCPIPSYGPLSANVGSKTEQSTV